MHPQPEGSQEYKKNANPRQITIQNKYHNPASAAKEDNNNYQLRISFSVITTSRIETKNTSSNLPLCLLK